MFRELCSPWAWAASGPDLHSSRNIGFFGFFGIVTQFWSETLVFLGQSHEFEDFGWKSLFFFRKTNDSRSLDKETIVFPKLNQGFKKLWPNWVSFTKPKLLESDRYGIIDSNRRASVKAHSRCKDLLEKGMPYKGEHPMTSTSCMWSAIALSALLKLHKAQETLQVEVIA